MSGGQILNGRNTVWLAVALFCSTAQPQDKVPKDDKEPISYAAAPEFWGEVERVLRSDVELHWTNQGVIDNDRGEREKIIESSLAVLAKLKNVSLPKLDGLKRVRVIGMPHYPRYSLLGYLIREEPDSWVLFTSEWRIQRMVRAKHTRIESSDVNAEINAALEYAALVRANRERGRAIEVPEALKDSQTHRLELLFDLGYLAFGSGRKEAVEPLLRAAFYQHAELLDRLYAELAWRQFESAILDLNQGAGRAGLARRFQRIASEFPGGKFEQQSTEYARKLREMSVEDDQFEKPTSLTSQSPGERVKSLIFQLRDCSAVQDSQPGACWIPSLFQPVEGPEANAADLLIKEGFDAVPALIEALNDTRLTRSYGFDRDFIPWRYVLEVRDAATQCLVTIADDLAGGPLDRQLYHPNATGLYFSNDNAEARTAAIGRFKDWWAKAQEAGEPAWLRTRLQSPGQSRARLLRRLVQIEKQHAVPDVRKWLAAEKYQRVYGYQLLMRAGGADAISEVKELANPASMRFEFEALSALNREGLITAEEYKSALLQGTEAMAKRDSGKLPAQVLVALTATGDRQCTLKAVERLRGGKSSFDRSMRWAIGGIKDPQIGTEVAGYLLPLFDITEIAEDSGWRQYYMNKPDIYRVKDDAAFTVNRLLDYPLPDFVDVTPPERDAEIEKLRKICTERGIRPAFTLSQNP